jgi:voltage-gated potassium channel
VQKTIDKLENHVIICGYGRIGSIVAREVCSHGKLPAVIVDKDPEHARRLEELGYLYLIGDATSDEILERAGIKRARALIAALSMEAANVYVALTARQLNPDIYIVARADSEQHITRLKMAGADRVMMPHTLGGVRMAQSVLRPTVTSFLEMAILGEGMDLQMEEVEISSSSELVDKDLIESQIRPRFNLIVIAIKKPDGEMIFNPVPQEILRAGDTLIVVGKGENCQELREIL